jgi:hypothetical protein
MKSGTPLSVLRAQSDNGAIHKRFREKMQEGFVI